MHVKVVYTIWMRCQAGVRGMWLQSNIVTSGDVTPPDSSQSHSYWSYTPLSLRTAGFIYALFYTIYIIYNFIFRLERICWRKNPGVRYDAEQNPSSPFVKLIQCITCATDLKCELNLQTSSWSVLLIAATHRTRRRIYSNCDETWIVNFHVVYKLSPFIKLESLTPCMD